MKIFKNIKNLLLQLKTVFPSIVAVTKSKGLQGLIVLIVVIIAGLFTQQQFEGIRINQAKMRNVAGVATEPTPTNIPFPTSTPVPIKKVQEVTAPKYDGTRTGRIIKYKEWCTQKEIQIYENEVIIKKFYGKTYGAIQSDWDCYEQAIAKIRNDILNELRQSSAPTTDSYDATLEQHRQNAQRITEETNKILDESRRANQEIMEEYIRKSEEISNRRLELPPVNINIPTPVPLKIIQEPTPTCYPVMFPNGAWGFSC